MNLLLVLMIFVRPFGTENFPVSTAGETKNLKTCLFSICCDEKTKRKEEKKGRGRKNKMNELVEYMPDVCNKRDVDKLKKYQSEGTFV